MSQTIAKVVTFTISLFHIFAGIHFAVTVKKYSLKSVCGECNHSVATARGNSHVAGFLHLP